MIPRRSGYQRRTGSNEPLGRRRVDLPVVAHVRTAVRDRRVCVLHVRHVEVDDAVEQGECLEAVVAAGVLDERQAQAAARGDGDGREDLRHDVAGRHEVDVVAAHGLELEHHLRELGGADRAPRPLLADVPVLAEDAAQVAPDYSAAELANLIEAANRVCAEGSRKSSALEMLKRQAASA